ncbi:MAG: haloacid dehalogenase type II [Pseudomonadota bacterium]
MQLSEFKALTFDVYGTLIDWESGMIAGLAPLTSRVPGLTRDQILEAHAYHESTTQAQTSAKLYPDVLAQVYKRLAEEWGIRVTWAECQTYGASVPAWPAFPDSAEALAYLRQHFKLIVLSNVDNQSFEGSNAKLGQPFHMVYTAQDCGAYKPSPGNFEYMLAQLARHGLRKDDILHTAESLFHDHQPAKQFGLANAWIYRRHDQKGFGATRDPGEMPEVDFRFNSMAELVEAHRAEVSGR